MRTDPQLCATRGHRSDRGQQAELNQLGDWPVARRRPEICLFRWELAQMEEEDSLSQLLAKYPALPEARHESNGMRGRVCHSHGLGPRQRTPHLK